MGKNRKIKLFKTIAAIFVFTIIIVMLFYIFPVMKEIYTKEGQIKFKEKIDNTGIIGITTLFLMQLAQTILFIIPGEPIEIIAGMCYGPIGGTAFIMFSTCIISLIIFILVRKFGKKLVYEFSDKNKIIKIEKSKLFNNSKKIELIMAILFLIPGTPKDLLVYVAGILRIKANRFIFISTVFRIPSIITSTFAGSKIIEGQWKSGALLYIIIVLMIMFFVYLFNYFDKEKTAAEAINIIK